MVYPQTENDSVDAATTITNTFTTDSLSARAWLSIPKVNKCLLFNGSLLHGVVPSIVQSRTSLDDASAEDREVSTHRTTVMLGFWGDGVHTNNYPGSKHSEELCGNMMFPSAGSDWSSSSTKKDRKQASNKKIKKDHRNSWVELFTFPITDGRGNANGDSNLSDDALSDISTDAVNTSNTLIEVDGLAWEKIQSSSSSKHSHSIQDQHLLRNALTSGSVSILSNWFQHGVNEMNDEIKTVLEGTTSASDVAKTKDTKSTSAVERVDSENMEYMSLADLKKLRGEI
mgnify:CR=1 FL=1